MKEIVGNCDQILEQMEEPLIVYSDTTIDEVPDFAIYHALAFSEDKLFSLVRYDDIDEGDYYNYYIHDNIDLSDYYKLF